MILYLVRHGRTLGADGLCVGHCDLEMDPAAEEGLHALAASFPVAPAHLFTSDLARARTTLGVLGIGWGGTITVEPRLREMSFGEWDGCTWEEIQREDGDRLQAWMEDWVEQPVPGGESFSAVAERVSGWANEVRAAHTDDELLAVAHAGSIRALLCRLLDWPLERAFRLQVDHGRVSAVKFGREPTLLFLNADRVPVQ
jgi:broad specificity phosphatase PhoE